MLTSGAAETVPDSSDFALQLKSALRRNTKRFLDSFMLYDEVRRGVRSSVPLLGALPGTGNQEGSGFLLFLRDDLVGTELAPAGTPAAVEAAPRRGALWVGGGFGLALPVLEGSSLLQPGPSLSSHLLYTLPTRYGTVGISFVTGAMGMATKAQVDPGYQMLSLPVALGLRYETFPSSSLFLRVDLTGGMLASFIRFSAPGTEPISTLKPFVQPSLSAGWQLSERFRAGPAWAGARSSSTGPGFP